jgi:hypothetical protein
MSDKNHLRKRESNVAAFGNTLAGRSDIGLVAYGYGLCYLPMEQNASKGHWDCTDRDLLWLQSRS